MNKYIYIAIGAVLVTSCKVGKDYKQPSIELPNQFYEKNSANDTIANTIAELSWKEFFQDDELTQYIEKALINNADLQLAIKNIEQANLLFKQSRLALLPNLSGQVGAARNSLSENSLGMAEGAPRNNNNFIAALDLSWEIDIWGKIRREKEVALNEYLQTTEVQKAVKNKLIADVAKAYVNLLMLDEQLQIAEKGLLLRENTYAITKKLFDVGNTSIIAVQQAEAQMLEAKELLPLIEQEIALQESAMSILLQHFPKTIERSVSINELNFTSSLNSGVPTSFLSQRPDIQIAEFEVKKMNARVGVAQSQMYPSLMISAQGGFNAIETSNWFTAPASLFGSIMGGITQPIFQSKKLRTQYEVAKIEREKAVINFKNAVLVGYTDVRDALVKLDKIKARQEQVQKRNILLNTSLDNTKQMFSLDTASYLEVINAQSLALQSNLNYAELKRDFLVAKIDLYRALGGN